MKNKELIAELSKLDPEATVILGQLEEDYNEAFEVNTVELRIVKRITRYWDMDSHGTPLKEDYFIKPYPKDKEGLEEVVLIDVCQAVNLVALPS
jgi:hypothetical protein